MQIFCWIAVPQSQDFYSPPYLLLSSCFLGAHWLPTKVSYLTPLTFNCLTYSKSLSAVLTLAKCCQCGIKHKTTPNSIERPEGEFRSCWHLPLKIPGMSSRWRQKCYCSSTLHLALEHKWLRCGSDPSPCGYRSLSQWQELQVPNPFSCFNTKPILPAVPSFK